MNARSNRKKNNKILKQKSPGLLPAMVALGGVCSLVALPVTALELGDIQVNSTLGQPLRASIAYALNPTEQIHDYCVYLRAGVPGNGMPMISNARVSITKNAILLAGTTPIREPMLNMQVVVDCAYTPHLLREYTLMIDPVAPVASLSVVATNTSGVASRQARLAAPVASESLPVRTQSARPTAVSSLADKSPIAVNTSFRVQPGDSASTIVSRIEDRSINLWLAVDILFAANPDAFVDHDVNQLLAGSELLIPSLSGAAAADHENATAAVPVDIDRSGAGTELIGDYPVVNPNDAAPASPPANAARALPAFQEEPEIEATMPTPDSLPVAELRPGDVVMSPIGAESTEIIITDTAIDNQSARVPVINSTTADKPGTSGAWNWLLWLGGTGLALILGLLVFGRTFRKRFGSFAAATREAPARRQGDDSTQITRVTRDVDFEFEDTINAQAISLDADLEAGTGLSASSSMDVAQDFGFAASGQVESELDMEITEDATQEPEASPTDIIQPHHRQEDSTILVSEEPPTDDEEYDLSMIVDATKQPIGDYDSTAKDLQAVQVDAAHSDDENSGYTVSTAVDYDILEQDYQEELTATQALNAEIATAAIELANRMDEDESIESTTEMAHAESTTPDFVCAELAAELPGPDVTRELPEVTGKSVVIDDMPIISDSDITAELTANLPTSIEAENDSIANGSLGEITVEMTAAGSDITVEMPVGSRKNDSRKK